MGTDINIGKQLRSHEHLSTLKKNEIFSLWVGGVTVLFVFLNVDLNLLSKNSKNQHLIFIKFSFF